MEELKTCVRSALQPMDSVQKDMDSLLKGVL